MGTHIPHLLLHEQYLDIQYWSRAWKAVNKRDRPVRDGKAAHITALHEYFQVPVSGLRKAGSNGFAATVVLLHCSFPTFTAVA
jgi:hypothetical protein